MIRTIRAGVPTPRRPLKLLALGGAVACACLATAGPASAQVPVTLTFHNAVMDLPSLGAVDIVKPSGTPLTATADVTPTSTTAATFTISPSDWSFPTYSFTTPAPGTINVNLKNSATGTVNFANGAVTMNADLLADVTLTGIGSCTVDTGSLNFATTNTQPLVGVDFPAGETGVTTGNGALGAKWSALASETGSACSVLSSYLAGAGGLWISGNITPPVVAVTMRKLKTVKAGKTETLNIRLFNSGGAPSGAIKLCLKAPKGVKGSSCKTVSNVAGGQSSAVTFKVKPTTKKSKTYKLQLTATPTAMALSSVSETVPLKVKK